MEARRSGEAGIVEVEGVDAGGMEGVGAEGMEGVSEGRVETGESLYRLRGILVLEAERSEGADAAVVEGVGAEGMEEVNEAGMEEASTGGAGGLEVCALKQGR